MCSIGLLAWSKGLGLRFAKTLSKNGIPCHYFTMPGGKIKFETKSELIQSVPYIPFGSQ